MRPIWAWIALLAVCCLAIAQTVAVSPGHSDDHSKHCCSFCHLGHSVVAQEARAAGAVIPLIAHSGCAVASTSSRYNPVQAGPSTSRGPPETRS